VTRSGPAAQIKYRCHRRNRCAEEAESEHPQKAVGYTQHWKDWLQSRQREFDSRIAFSMDLQNAVMMIPFVLFGVVLARRRGWGIATGVLQIVMTMRVVIALASIFPGPPPFSQGQWVGIALLVVTGLLRLWLEKPRAAARGA
jgi:hypothetical protein